LKFEIPEGLGYPQGWFGDACNEATVILYNHIDGYGIAETNEVIDESITYDEVDVLLTKSINQLTADTEWKPIFFTDGLIPEDDDYNDNHIRNRWSKDVEKLENKTDINIKGRHTKVLCDKCFTFIKWLPSGITIPIELTCKNGHKVVLNGK
jgi:hypothetical protein